MHIITTTLLDILNTLEVKGNMLQTGKGNKGRVNGRTILACLLCLKGQNTKVLPSNTKTQTHTQTRP